MLLSEIHPRQCDIVFVHSYHIPSATVRWWTNSLFDHVEIVVDDATSIGSRPRGGVQIHPFSVFDNRKICDWTLMRYSGNLSKNTKNGIINFAKSQIGKPYDWYGILGIAIKKNIEKESEWFCSEFVNTAFFKNNVTLIPRKSSGFVVPELLYQSLALDLIYTTF